MKPCFIRNVLAPLSGLAALLATAPLGFFYAFDWIEARLYGGVHADLPPTEPLLGGLLIGLAAGALAGFAAMKAARMLAR